MSTLTGSVGKDGKNLAADVTTVQKLLNLHIGQLMPLRPLQENGKMDDGTIAAITEFQRRVVRLSQPDGRVDPGGKTWRQLIAVAFEQLAESGDGYYLYGPKSRAWGTPDALTSIKAAARKVKAALSVEIGIGDVSLEHGGLMSPHQSHQKGLDVDVRPLRGDGKHLPVTFTAADYSRERTKKLVEVLREDSNLEKILFNDTAISGVISFQGHDNHLHVRFRK